MADVLSWLYKDPRSTNELAKLSNFDAALEFLRGVGMGATTDTLGYPVDVMTMALRPLGYDVEKPVGGSDWLAEQFTSPTGSRLETAGRVAGGMVTPGPEDLMRMAGMLPQRVPVNELTTYHGSPHRINNVDEQNPLGKFDLSKVGTGEGGQAYGHGIYLAENPNVAHSYKKMSDAQDLVIIRNGKEIARGNEISDDVLEVAKFLEMGRKDAGQFPHNTAYYAKKYADSAAAGLPGAAKRNERVKALIDEYADARFEYKPNPGHFYTVDLPDEHIAKMLDWDAPLSEQPEAVRKALTDAYAEKLESMKRVRQKDGTYGYTRKDGNGKHVIYDSKLDYFQRMGRLPDSTSGREIYQRLGLGGSAEQVSEKLRSLGIPGIKYFDQGSRAAGQGTRNFVIFDPDIAKILKRE